MTKTNSILPRDKIKQALDYALSKISENIESFEGAFPSVFTNDKMYHKTKNRNWTEGFWAGLIWLAYEVTGEDKYKIAGDACVESFKNRLDNNINLEHHDIGFLYTLSCVACYKLTGSEIAKETAIRAADKLIGRYQKNGEFIRAWGEMDDPQANRLIIDCLMNLPLLYWASKVTGDKKYYEIAHKHAKTTAKTIIRNDATTFHTFYFNNDTGEPLRGATAQGYADNSCWARGQAWGVYGFFLSFIHTNDEIFKNACIKITDYFIENLPEDYVPYWDMIFGDDDGEERDSSAAAIAACALLQFDKLSQDDKYKNKGIAIISSLVYNYTTKDIISNGLIDHSVTNKKSGKGVDECCIWGDYFYMEALVRLYKGQKIYW